MPRRRRAAPTAVDTLRRPTLDDAGRRATLAASGSAGGKRRAAVGARRDALDRRRRGELARLARRRRRRSSQHVGELRRVRRRGRAARASRTRCCSAWAARASCPEVLRAHVRPHGRATPSSHVLDSTDPAQVAAVERQRRPRARRSSSSSSKSGSTLEPNIFKQYFFERVQQAVGRRGGRAALRRDHRSRLASSSRSREGDGFRRIFAGVPIDRRALLGALGLRPGAGGGRSGSTSRASSGARPTMARGLRAARRPPRRTRASCSASILGVAREARPRQADARRLTARSRASAPGSSSSSPSRPASTARASSRSTASRSARPRSTATTALFVYVAPRRRAPTRRRTRRVDALEQAGQPVVRIARRRRATTSAPSSSAGRSRPRSRARSSASIRSTSPTSRRARSRRAR